MGDQGQRRLRAIFFSDIVGYSRQMEQDELAALSALRAHNAILDAAASAHGGRVVKTVGDAYMIAFDSSVSAVACALEAQTRIEANPILGARGLPIRIRVGVHAGDVQEEGGDLFGEAVNLAARLEGQADPGTVCLSEAVLVQVRGKVKARVRGPELRRLKNIAEPVPVYLLQPADAWSISASAAPVEGRSGRFRLGGAVLLLLLLGGLGWWQLRPDDSVEASKPAAVATEGPRGGGVLTILSPLERGHPLRFEMHSDMRSLDWVAHAITAESLFAGGAHGEVEPWLTDTFSITEGRHARISLREGIRFHPHPCLGEGPTLATVEDLAFSFERQLPQLGLPLEGSEAAEGAVFGTVKRIWVEGDDVHVETQEPQPLLFNYLSSVLLLPRDMEGCAALEDPETFLPTTGPFRVVSAGPREIELEAFGDYWRKDADGRDLPYLDRILLRHVDLPGSRVSKLLAGEAQLIDLGDDVGGAFVALNPSTRQLEPRGALAGAPVVLGRRGRLLSVVHGFFPVPSGPGPLEHRSVRQAVSLAVTGECSSCPPERKTLLATGRLFEPGQPGFDPSFTGRRHDLEAARDAREAAQKELGSLAPLRVGCPTGDPGYCRTLAVDLRAAGFEVELSFVGPERIWSATLEGSFDLIEAKWAQSEAIKQKPDFFLAGWFDYFPKIGYPRGRGFELAREMRSTESKERRLELVATLERHVIEAGMAIPFARGEGIDSDVALGVLVSSPELRGWIDPVVGLVPMDLARIAEAWLERPSEGPPPSPDSG